MASPTKDAPSRVPAPESQETTSGAAAMIALAWLVPGAAHVMLGQFRKGVVFFVALMTLFILGLTSRGQLVPVQLGEPLALLMALAEWGIAVPRLVAPLLGFGAGQVTAATY